MGELKLLLFFIAFSLVPVVFADSNRGISGFFKDLNSSEGYFNRKEKREWYKENKGKLTIIGNASLNCSKKKQYKPECNFKAKLLNSSKDQITSLILRLKIYNKSTLVQQEVYKFGISIFPTIEKNENIDFYSVDLADAINQLGENNWTWNYDLIGYLPSHLDDGDYSQYLSGHEFEWLSE